MFVLQKEEIFMTTLEDLYAKTREECEVLLADMIPKIKAKIAEEKEKLKAQQSA